MAEQSDKELGARKRKPKLFYVYTLYEVEGVVLYVGKGSGRRLQNQKRNFGLSGEIVKEFATEERAYAYEQRLISICKPELNKNKGGAGGWVNAQRKRRRRYDWEIEMDRIGTRAYAARMLLRFDMKGLVERGTLDRIREVAHAAPL